MTKTQTQQALDENISKDVISTREGGGSKTLSYLETWYVIDRLNQVLGQGNWGYQTHKLDKVFEGEVDQYSGKVHATSYIATVALFATVEGKTVIFTEVGYGDGTDKKNPGKAHELATKEAVSDGLKRAAKNLGRSMGLALYDKTQEYVEGTSKPAVTTKTGSGAGGVNILPQNTPKHTPTMVDNKPKNNTTGAARPIKELITAAFKVLEAQGKVTKDEFKTKYQNGAGISKLTDEQLSGVWNAVKTDFPNLSL